MKTKTSKGILAKAENAAGNLRLHKIQLWESNCNREISFQPKKVEVTIEIKVKLLKTLEDDLVPFGCRFKITGNEITEQKIAFEFLVSYCVVYKKKNNAEFTKEDLHAFGMTNAVFNAWPYLREHIQSTMAKMDLPIFTLHPMTIGQLGKQSIDAEEDSERQAES